MNRYNIFYLIFLFIITLSCNNSNSSVKSSEKLYNERYRPQVHFSPATSWMNDPNGLVFFEGECGCEKKTL